jgi:hypothetical protein
MEFYPDASGEIPKDLPPEKGPRVSMTLHVDADHVQCEITCLLDGSPSVRRQWRHELMAPNRWLHGLLRN